MARPALFVVLALTLVGCGESSTADRTVDTVPASSSTLASPSTPASPSTLASPAPTEARALPPHERVDLAAMFDPLVAPLGYEVTRAALIRRDTYVVDPEGDHLAIYLAPVDDIAPDRFALDLPGIVAVFLPEVFDRWPALESFDVCQEPYDSTEETPPSLTLVDVTREAAAEVVWDGIELAGLIDAGRSVDGLAVWARTGVRDSTPWQDALDG